MPGATTETRRRDAETQAEAMPAPIPDDRVRMDRAARRSLSYCRKLVRKRARNFYYGMKLTPEPKRSALYAIYAFMRACDDLADQPAAQTSRQESPYLNMANISRRIAVLEGFRERMTQVIRTGVLPEMDEPAKPIWPAFNHVMRAYPIDPDHLHAMLDGQRRDLLTQKFQTFDELYDYCYKVAGVVGLVCISVWGTSGDPAATKLAEYRGIAFQLTNILRDLNEDAQRDRTYIPQEELDRFNVSPRTFLGEKVGDNFDRLMNFQIERARSYYEMSQTLENYIDPACQSTSWAMMKIYRGLLERIAMSPRSVLTQRVRLSSFTKMGIALRSRFRRPTRVRDASL
ncbi:MAG: phytoene/squalene synthase family protein [Phycisphaeraceae bacterium]|nr:phytoene/squalene synthase family protein [Phycisphaeraceae bacterium]